MWFVTWSVRYLASCVMWWKKVHQLKMLHYISHHSRERLLATPASGTHVAVIHTTTHTDLPSVIKKLTRPMSSLLDLRQHNTFIPSYSRTHRPIIINLSTLRHRLPKGTRWLITTNLSNTAWLFTRSYVLNVREMAADQTVCSVLYPCPLNPAHLEGREQRTNSWLTDDLAAWWI